MKIFILCGGYGTRLNYEGTLKAKPMIRIGKYPILKHIIDNFCDPEKINKLFSEIPELDTKSRDYMFANNKFEKSNNII